VSTSQAALPEGAKIKLSVVKGSPCRQKLRLKEGVTYIGRKGSHAVDVDITEQENPGAAVAVNRLRPRLVRQERPRHCRHRSPPHQA